MFLKIQLAAICMLWFNFAFAPFRMLRFYKIQILARGKHSKRSVGFDFQLFKGLQLKLI